MRKRTYRWTCHVCEHVNEPQLESCSACGFPAVADAVAIAHAKGQPSPIGETYRAAAKEVGWFSAIIAVMLPWWSS
jgi:hypothetical protein